MLRRTLLLRRSIDDDVAKFASVSRSGHLAHVDGASWLSDGKDTKYRSGLLKTKKGPRQIAFEVPSDATGFVWNDGKKRYRLEPHPELLADAPATEAKQAGAKPAASKPATK